MKAECHYLSGPDLQGVIDGDRCKEQPTVRLRFEGDPRWVHYCDKHANIAAGAFNVSEVAHMRRKAA